MRLFGFDIRRIQDKTPTVPESSLSVPESHRRISDFFPELQKAALNSEEHYDQKIFAISAGAIGVELTVLQFVDTNTHYIGFAIAAVSCFISSLLLNLVVHYIAKGKQDKQSDMIRAFLDSEKTDDSFIYDRIRKDNKTLRNINLISIVVLTAGLTCLAVFAFINLFSNGS